MSGSTFIFYGVRGSYPVPSSRTLKYGGNTPSILIENGDDFVIFDAGTGLIEMGRDLMEKRPGQKEIHIFLSHLHIDHIQGFPFFEPIYDDSYEINVYCDESPDTPLEKTFYSLFNKPISPIGNDGVKAKVNFIILDIVETPSITIGSSIVIDYIKEPLHPQSGVMFYSVATKSGRLVYATDVESPEGMSPEHIEFIKGADVLIHDTMYFEDDYFSEEQSKKGYGHSTISMAVANAIKGGVKKLFLFHYNPVYGDKDIERMHKKAVELFPRTYMSEELKKFSIG
jgi:phosphoribosyl 1,2-cyclic phosphodiesterase